MRQVEQRVARGVGRSGGQPDHELDRHCVRAVDERVAFLLDPAAHACLIRIADLDCKPRVRDPLDALGIDQRGGDRIGVRAHEAARAELHAAEVAHDGAQHAVQVVMAQHFENRPAGGAGRLAVVGHPGLAAREQRPADVRRARMLGAQPLQFGHRRVAVLDGDRVCDEAALADVEFARVGGGERVGHVPGGERDQEIKCARRFSLLSGVGGCRLIGAPLACAMRAWASGAKKVDFTVARIAAFRRRPNAIPTAPRAFAASRDAARCVAAVFPAGARCRMRGGGSGAASNGPRVQGAKGPRPCQPPSIAKAMPSVQQGRLRYDGVQARLMA
ncbi:xaa-Pro dipeptidase domain protein [Burkholderia pseudomallei]|nr:xaa-Pro dipeptidase domain protein [Burkholderia pseudomallei]